MEAKREDDENLNSIVVAETMKLLAYGPYGYHIMDCSRHTVTKYLSDGKTPAAIDSELFKKLNYLNNSLYEVDLAKAQVEHKEANNAGIFILQYAKLRMLELYYTFCNRFFDVNKFERLEKDTHSLYLAFAEKLLEDCIGPRMKTK